MSEINYPQGTRVIASGDKRIILGVIGRSGAGKSHLVYQLAHDPDYGPDEVLVLMSEDATSTYDAPVHVINVASFEDVRQATNEVAKLAAQGKRVPRVIVYDSPSGTGDDEMEQYALNPIIAKSSGNRDKLAEFGEFGENFKSMMRHFHRRSPVDVVVLVTCYEEEGKLPELRLPGKVAVRNFTALTSSTLHLRAVRGDFDPAKRIPEEAPHREIARYENGNLILENGMGIIVQRYFWTRDAGEICAKGHHNLAVRERAILPDVLRKIHGQAPPPTEGGANGEGGAQ